jgi:cell division protein FtsZ
MPEELINFELPVNQSSIIKVVGVGGGGGNAVNHMHQLGIKDVDFVVCNTDAQALANSPVSVKIQLGSALTEGRGAGNKPEIGRQAALENIGDLEEVITKNTKMIFITAGMGGGTGTGAAPVIAKAAHELGLLTVGIVTIPFRFEGQQRINQAIDGILHLQENVDSLLIINNEKLREIYGDLKLSEAFAKADNVLATAAKGIAEIITVHGYINVDFADVQTVMTNSGVAIMGSGVAEGEGRALKAIQEALTSPLLNNNDITGAKNILLNITSGVEEVSMDEVGQITDFLTRSAAKEATIIWGTGNDVSLGKQISVTVVATGFEANSIPELYGKRKSTTEKVTLNATSRKPSEFLVKDKQNSSKVEKSNIAQKSIEFDLLDKGTRKVMIFEGEDLDIRSNMPVDSLKAAERIKDIKNIQSKLMDKHMNIEDLESQPAFVRRNVKIDGFESADTSDVSGISKFSLNEEEDKSVRLSDNNPYLFDNVD